MAPAPSAACAKTSTASRQLSPSPAAKAIDATVSVRKTLRMAVRMTKTDGLDDPPPSPGRRVPVNMSLPEELLHQLDEVAGPRNRSAFAEDALRRAIRREKFRIAAERYAGSLKAADYPHWRTSEDVVAWVREMRAEETSTEVDVR
jgi:predicted transcriptional regulator